MSVRRREFLLGAAAAVSGCAGAGEPAGKPAAAQPGEPAPRDPSTSPSVRKAVDYLARRQDVFHVLDLDVPPVERQGVIDVYTGSDAAGNHFVARARMPLGADPEVIPPMVEDWSHGPHSGLTCIKATFNGTRQQAPHWGGWYFQNGVLEGEERTPKANWGTFKDAGVNLRGVTELTFFARGKDGGEEVEFFLAGVGRDEQGEQLPDIPFPDSSPKISTGFIRLTNEWTRYRIPLRGRNLTYVLGGFGWVARATKEEVRNITFFIDDIRYILDRPNTLARLQQKRFIVSYETDTRNDKFDKILRNVAFTYDNALALMAFIAVGRGERAKHIADAFVEAMRADRLYGDGRLRTGYQGGDLILPRGWRPYNKPDRMRTPGWMDPDEKNPKGDKIWLEDAYFLGANTGNMAWVALGLLAYHETFTREARSDYLKTAIRLADWIADKKNCHSDLPWGGFTAGVETDAKEPLGTSPEHNKKLTYRATEHALDLYAVFSRLAYLDPARAQEWTARAAHARKFLMAMWDPAVGKFWTGSTLGKDEINKDNVPLDVQPWFIMSDQAKTREHWRGLAFAEKNCKLDEGYDFNCDRDAVWYEGTAQMAEGYRMVASADPGKGAPWLQGRKEILAFLESRQLPSGAMPAASKDGLTTGFKLNNGEDWLYFERPHVGATAWFILAEMGINPFWMGSKGH